MFCAPYHELIAFVYSYTYKYIYVYGYKLKKTHNDRHPESTVSIMIITFQHFSTVNMLSGHYKDNIYVYVCGCIILYMDMRIVVFVYTYIVNKKVNPSLDCVYFLRPVLFTYKCIIAKHCQFSIICIIYHI